MRVERPFYVAAVIVAACAFQHGLAQGTGDAQTVGSDGMAATGSDAGGYWAGRVEASAARGAAPCT